MEIQCITSVFPKQRLKIEMEIYHRKNTRIGREWKDYTRGVLLKVLIGESPHSPSTSKRMPKKTIIIFFSFLFVPPYTTFGFQSILKDSLDGACIWVLETPKIKLPNIWA